MYSECTSEINDFIESGNEPIINAKSVTPSAFASSLRQSMDLFVAKLYSNPYFPRNLIQKVVVDSKWLGVNTWHF